MWNEKRYDFEKSELLGTNEFKYLSLNNGLSIDSINVNISVVSNEEMKDEDRNKGFILDKYLNNTTYPYYFEKGLVVA